MDDTTRPYWVNLTPSAHEGNPLAIYHLNANVISRARGQSIVAAVAYRAGARLRDERYGVVHNYVGRRVVHAEIMAPAGTPEWAYDREQLWNRVEAAERRKDSQLARVIELGLPVELTPDQALVLVRDYVATTFVARGMIADCYLRRDNPNNPHAHILLTLRSLTAQGFGRKERRWNGRANLIEWRTAWAACANQHLARAGHPARIDHRTLDAQQIELTPARRAGIGRAPADAVDLPAHLAERIAEQGRIARANGEAIVQDPTVALRALTHRSPSFTDDDLERFLRSRTADDVQFREALAAVRRSPELMALSGTGEAVRRYTSGDMVEAAKSLQRRVASMAARRGHAVTPHNRIAALTRMAMNDAEARIFEELVDDGAVTAMLLSGDPGTFRPLETAIAAWRTDGLHVVRAPAHSLDAVEAQWSRGCDVLTANSVLVVEAADLVGLKQLERVIGVADRIRAKVALIGDPARLEAMGGSAPLWSVLQAMRTEAR